MNRESINPVDWGLQFSMGQGEIVEGAKKHLRCSGQISVTPDPEPDLGFSVESPGDIRGQIEHALSNVDAVLAKASMAKRNIVNLRFFTTDIDWFLLNYDVYSNWIAEAGKRPPQSLLGVNRLVLEDILVEIEVEAAS